MDYLTYAILAGLATIVGGILPLYTKTRMRYLIGFVAGVLIATAFFEMIPEVQENALALGLGFFSLYVLEKVLMIHSCGEKECRVHRITLASVVGIGLDNFVDGAAIATGYLINPMLGLTIAIAVAIHELPQGFSTTVIMKKEKYKLPRIFLVLLVVAVLTPLGAFLSIYFPEWMFKNILAFAAGTFVYVGASDLLPEAHKKFNIRVILSVIIGASIIPALGLLI